MAGPLSVEWEDGKMDRETGRGRGVCVCEKVDFKPSEIIFDAQFDREKQAK